MVNAKFAIQQIDNFNKENYGKDAWVKVEMYYEYGNNKMLFRVGWGGIIAKDYSEAMLVSRKIAEGAYLVKKYSNKFSKADI